MPNDLYLDNALYANKSPFPLNLLPMLEDIDNGLISALIADGSCEANNSLVVPNTPAPTNANSANITSSRTPTGFQVPSTKRTYIFQFIFSYSVPLFFALASS